MTTRETTRKLVAVLSADAVGYSRLMGDNEEDTVRTISLYRQLMIDMIGEYSGRIVDAKGDNLLGEFASVVDAVTCSIAIQIKLSQKNADLPEHRKMRFRIGINIGDVIDRDGAIYGDGVNIAARLEALADPGGICVSGIVYDQVKNKVDVSFQNMGTQKVKNISDPIQAYKVVPQAEGVEKSGVVKKNYFEQRSKARSNHRLLLVGAALLLIVGAATAFWIVLKEPTVPQIKPGEMILPLPKKPSIAVLPFDNLSDDPKQDYLAAGFTENITSAMAKISTLFVVDATSSQAYGNQPTKKQLAAKELGVRYILEGSVNKSGSSIRVTARLVDMIKGNLLWAESYDRNLSDIFELLDEITKQIVVAMQVNLSSGEQARMWHRHTENLEAWGLVVKGSYLFIRFTKEENSMARNYFRRAVELDPEYAFAWTMLAWSNLMDARQGWSESAKEKFILATNQTKKALSLDPNLSDTQSLVGSLLMLKGDYKKAIDALKRAVALSPSNATGHALLSWALQYVGRFDEAVAQAQQAVRLHPNCPAFFLYHLGNALRMAGRFEESLTVYEQLYQRSKNKEYSPIISNLLLAEVNAELDRVEKAKSYAREVLRLDPNFTLDLAFKHIAYKDPAHLERRLSALRKAGLK
jgi:adenylate cyclase